MTAVEETSPEGWVDWSDDERQLWRRWTLANGAGEVVGLGLLGVLAVVVAFRAGLGGGVPSAAWLAVLFVGLGTLEGAVVGCAQWLAMRRAVPSVGAARWVVATAAGAGVAWALGSLPSALGAFGEAAGAGAEPPLVVVLPLAALLGVVAGVVLSVAQWLVLRGHVAAAWRWLPANALAWAVGMPVVFLGVSLVPARPPDAVTVAVVLATAGAAGLVVGAVHGVALVRLSR